MFCSKPTALAVKRNDLALVSMGCACLTIILEGAGIAAHSVPLMAFSLAPILVMLYCGTGYLDANDKRKRRLVCSRKVSLFFAGTFAVLIWITVFAAASRPDSPQFAGYTWLDFNVATALALVCGGIVYPTARGYLN